MKDIVDAFRRGAHRCAVGNRPLDEFTIQSVEIFAAAAAQVVEHPYVGPALEIFHDMAADKTGAAGNQHSH